MKIENGIQRGLSLVYLITLFSFLWQKNNDHIGLLIGGFFLCYLPWLVQKFFRVELPIGATIVTIAFIFCCQYLGSLVRFYDRYPWWDIALHFFSGFLLAYWGIVFLMVLDRRGTLYKERKVAFIVLFAALSGIASAGVWEVIEYLCDVLIGANTQLGSLSDTMEDIICGTIGAGLFALYIGIMLKHGRHCLVDTLFEKNLGGNR